MLHARFPPLLGGGLEPLFRVLFSAIFHGVSPGISIRVENYGIERKENCSQPVVILSTELICVGAILCLFTGMWRIPPTLRFEVLTCGGILCRRDFIWVCTCPKTGAVICSENRYSATSYIGLRQLLRNSARQQKMPHDLSSISEFRFNAKEH